MPPELDGVSLAASPREALSDSDAAAVCTEWPVFREALVADALTGMRRPLVIDANRFLASTLATYPRVEYITVGQPA